MEIIDLKIRRKEDPDKWPLPALAMGDPAQTDFSQLINCPEFVPRQPSEPPKGKGVPPPQADQSHHRGRETH